MDLFQCPECLTAVRTDYFVNYTSKCRSCQRKFLAKQKGTPWITKFDLKYTWVVGVPAEDQAKYLRDRSLCDELLKRSIEKRN